MNRKLTSVLGIFLSLLVNSNCNRTLSSDEMIFKKGALRLARFFYKYYSIPVNKIKKDKFPTIPFLDTTIYPTPYILDFSRHSEHVRTNTRELIEIADSLENIVTKFPNSKWSDDAMFLICVEYILLAESDTLESGLIMAKTKCKLLEDFYKNGNIELWTKRNLRQLWRSYFTGIEEEREKFGEWEIIKIFIKMGLANVFISKNKFGEAEILLEQIMQEYPNSVFSQDALRILEITRTRSR